MKETIAVNPYLPFWETIPDAEPRIFGDRLYLFGSHDELGGTAYCTNDYACWSASVNNLGDWKYEGIIYRKVQDPLNGAPYHGKMPKIADEALATAKHNLYAPDAVQGPDGRYYLFYGPGYANIISVAVCNTPAGQYEFLDFVRYADGTVRNNARYFDPAVTCEPEGIFLYYGFCPKIRFPGMETTPYPGAMVVKLADDMHTIITEPVMVANGIESANATSYEAHPFFEAPSIRHFGEWYYFIYSSIHMHELCYGMAKSPYGPFEYKGVLVSNGNLGYQGNTIPQNYYANNHGSIVEINGIYYIFGHRHTMGSQFSRQGIADVLTLSEDGSFSQAELTSCGLNNGPLPAARRYQAQIACHLTGPVLSEVGVVPDSIPGQPLVPIPENMPYITVEKSHPGLEKGMYSYIYNLQKNAVVGIKYLNFSGKEDALRLILRGNGTLVIKTDCIDGEIMAIISSNSADWNVCTGTCKETNGVHAIYFVVENGCIDFSEFEFLQASK